MFKSRTNFTGEPRIFQEQLKPTAAIEVILTIVREDVAELVRNSAYCNYIERKMNRVAEQLGHKITWRVRARAA